MQKRLKETTKSEMKKQKKKKVVASEKRPLLAGLSKDFLYQPVVMKPINLSLHISL